jgi:tetratricopeptide (TPR) repeat protein
MTEVTSPKSRCIACRETIEPDARLCPHCRTSQSPDRWKLFGTILKWVGGSAAVISLLTAMLQVNSLFRSWQSRQETVSELAKAARLQANAGDYAGAWKLYDQALQLEPGSRPARDGQGDLAMQWLRDIRVSEKQSFSQVVDPLLPVLYRAAVSGNNRRAADALAHIGWANYLKNRDLGTASSGELAGPSVEEQFQAALRADSANVYAHAMWGFWIAYRGGDLSEADRHFSEALKAGRDRQYVQSLRIWAYLNREGDTEAAVALIRLADEMRQNRENIEPGTKMRIV